MVDTKRSYDSLILLERGRTFHFNGPPPVDLRTSNYLTSSKPDEVISAVLACAQQGDFSQMWRLRDLMKRLDDGVVWGRCATLYAHAAPFSALQDLIQAFSHELFEGEDISTQGWITEILCRSGALWCVPVVLRILRRNSHREKYFATPRYLSFLMEPERGEIAEGPRVLPRTDDFPSWFNVPEVYADDQFQALVMARYEELRAQVRYPDQAAFVEGEPLTQAHIAERALVRIRAGEDVEEVAIARTWLEAATGADLSDFYDNGVLQSLRATAATESLLESGALNDFESGLRYFFRHRIPE